MSPAAGRGYTVTKITTERAGRRQRHVTSHPSRPQHSHGSAALDIHLHCHTDCHAHAHAFSTRMHLSHTAQSSPVERQRGLGVGRGAPAPRPDHECGAQATHRSGTAECQGHCGRAEAAAGAPAPPDTVSGWHGYSSDGRRHGDKTRFDGFGGLTPGASRMATHQKTTYAIIAGLSSCCTPLQTPAMRFRTSDNFGWRRSFSFLKCEHFVRYWCTDVLDVG